MQNCSNLDPARWTTTPDHNFHQHLESNREAGQVPDCKLWRQRQELYNCENAAKERIEEFEESLLVEKIQFGGKGGVKKGDQEDVLGSNSINPRMTQDN